MKSTAWVSMLFPSLLTATVLKFKSEIDRKLTRFRKIEKSDKAELTTMYEVNFLKVID